MALENKKTPSVLALTRQKVDSVRKENSWIINALGRIWNYEKLEKVNCTIFASGSEVSLAIEVCHKLATENIYSKVVSVPCQELFEKQNIDYKKKYRGN